MCATRTHRRRDTPTQAHTLRKRRTIVVGLAVGTIMAKKVAIAMFGNSFIYSDLYYGQPFSDTHICTRRHS